MQIALINTNRIKPPIAPIGLEYVAESLSCSGHDIEILDLCWADNIDSAISSFFNKKEFGLVGVSLRNTDDCAFTSRESFLNQFFSILTTIRKYTEGLIVLGGVGFSTMPEQILTLCNADTGIWGDGEFTIVKLADRLEKKQEWNDLPNIIWYRDGSWYRNPIRFQSLEDLPLMNRNFFDNRRYFHEGGQAGIETKRGCTRKCIYCADPIAKGNKIRTRTPRSVVDELEKLLEQGIDHIHMCDSEFNLPEFHAAEVCREIIRRNLGKKLRWYTYCSPVPFSKNLADLMHNAGCVGINFGVDNGDDNMLKRLRRDYAIEDIKNTARLCKESGITVMFDLLLGSPGETKDSIERTIEMMRKVKPERVGVSMGVRIYPGTELEKLVKKKNLQKGLIDKGDLLEPLFFIEPGIATFFSELLDNLIGDDRRFFFFDPSKPDRNYNYNANQRLVNAIQDGHRGAYWDILRRIEKRNI